MAVSLTPQNKQTLKRLLKTGRWNNESEVIRYGLHLVNKEVDGGQNLSPYTAAELRRALGAESRVERREQQRIGRAAARPKRKRDLE